MSKRLKPSPNGAKAMARRREREVAGWICEGGSSGDIVQRAMEKFKVSVRQAHRYLSAGYKLLAAETQDISVERERALRELERQYRRMDQMARGPDELKAEAERTGEKMSMEDLVAALEVGKDATYRAAKMIELRAKIAGVIGPGVQVNVQNNIHSGVLVIGSPEKAGESAIDEWAEEFGGDAIDADAVEQ